MKLIALNKRVIAKKTVEKPEEDGMFIPQAAMPLTGEAVIESVGSLVKEMKVGDHVIFDPGSATISSIGGIEYIIVDEEGILAKVGE